MSSLETRRTAAHSGRSATASVHALRVAEGRPTVLTHVTFWTLADFFMVAPSAVSALFIALRIGTVTRAGTADG